MVFKQNLTALSKGGTITKHKGKGSQMAGMPDRSQISQLTQPAGQSINNYAKASPMGAPPPNPPPAGATPAPPANGIGSGNWAGNGM